MLALFPQYCPLTTIHNKALLVLVKGKEFKSWWQCCHVRQVEIKLEQNKNKTHDAKPETQGRETVQTATEATETTRITAMTRLYYDKELH